MHCGHCTAEMDYPAGRVEHRYPPRSVPLCAACWMARPINRFSLVALPLDELQTPPAKRKRSYTYHQKQCAPA